MPGAAHLICRTLGDLFSEFDPLLANKFREDAATGLETKAG